MNGFHRLLSMESTSTRYIFCVKDVPWFLHIQIDVKIIILYRIEEKEKKEMIKICKLNPR